MFPDEDFIAVGDGGGYSGHSGEVGGEVGVEVFANGRVDAVGADEEGCCGGGWGGGEGEGDSGGGFSDDVAEFVAVFDGDLVLVEGGEEGGDEDVAVDAQGRVAVLGLAAEFVSLDEVVGCIAKVEIVEVVALGFDGGVNAERVEDAEGVGGQHHGTSDVERFRTRLVHGAWDGLLVKGESEA